MHDRTALGAADVSDDELRTLVAALLDRQPGEVELLDSHAEEVAYDIPAITTATRAWVRGSARVTDGVVPYSLFVKHVQSWARSPFFEAIPPELREMAEAGVPWRTEPLVYRSGLAAALPKGLTMARALGVYDLDEKSAAVWLEEVPVSATPWDHERFRRAARALGRLAGSRDVWTFAEVGQHDWTVAEYLNGRLNFQVFPLLRTGEVWEHPLVAGAFDDELRRRILDASDLAAAYVEELMALPVATGHGDASPNNLLVRDDTDDFVLIDFGFWGRRPIGFDLSQLVVGDIQLGRRSTADMAELDELCTAAYMEGLREEGFEAVERDVRRAHALQLLIFTGYSALPMEHLDSPLTPELAHMAAERAAIARFSLDLVDATA